jgi:hypothetical protein
MASTYSALKIQLMATGENSGTWGNVTNDNLGVAIEEAIAESADVTFSGSNVSITLSGVNVNASDQVTSVGFMRGKFSDDVVALGNTGAATTINLAAGTVFTATLTDNCTFTFANPNGTASTGSSFTLILTNDATPSRSIVWPATVQYSDGTVPARTETATAKDIWFFFTPDGGSVYYGSIPIKNLSTP